MTSPGSSGGTAGLWVSSGRSWRSFGRVWGRSWRALGGGHFPGVGLRSEAIGDSHLAWGCYIWKVFRWDVQKSILRDKNVKNKSSQNMVCLPLKLLTKPVGAFSTYLEPPISHIAKTCVLTIIYNYIFIYPYIAHMGPYRVR